LAPRFRSMMLVGLALLFALSALAMTVLLLLSFVDVNPLEVRLNALIILWILVAPISLAAALLCVRRARPGATVSTAEESAAILALAALTAFCSAWALYNRNNSETWDSLRLFLAGVFLVALV